MIVSMHITHRSAGGSQGLNDAITMIQSQVPERIQRYGGIDGYVIVRTCNRFEIYTATSDNPGTAACLQDMVRTLLPFPNIAYVLEDRDSVKHLFRVVCGLDSLIVGEDQIQHQVRESYAKAKEEGHAGPLLSGLFENAMIVGKRVRSETALNRGAVSIGSAAVQLAQQKIGNLEGKTITILGAGDMASVIAKNLIGKNVGAVFVSNRTFSHASELAADLGGTAVRMDRLVDTLANSDLVLVATGAPHTVLHRSAVADAMAERPSRKMLVIDVSMPHNVDADITEVGNVALENMDSLESIAQANVERRTKEISAAEKIILAELERIDRENRERDADEVIRAINMKLSAVRETELERARSRSSANTDEVLEDMSRAIVSKITADLYCNLRKASRDGDANACRIVAEMFGVN